MPQSLQEHFPPPEARVTGRAVVAVVKVRAAPALLPMAAHQPRRRHLQPLLRQLHLQPPQLPPTKPRQATA